MYNIVDREVSLFNLDSIDICLDCKIRFIGLNLNFKVLVENRYLEKFIYVNDSFMVMFLCIFWDVFLLFICF